MNIVLNFGNSQEKIIRNKGNNLLAFPKDYTIIDIETTGLDPKFDSIIEVSAIRYVDGLLLDKFSSLIQPDSYFSLNDDSETTDYILKDGNKICYVDKFITELTGITNEMLSSAPNTKDVLSDFYSFLGQGILIGHNVNFDINFLYDNFVYYLNKELHNDFIDTVRISRRLHPDLKHHRLIDIATVYSIDCVGTHRALRDCEITNSCYKELYNTLINAYGNLDTFLAAIKKLTNLRASDISTGKKEFDISHPLYEKVCVFTGTLERMVRRDAMQIVADLGGINGDTVTAKTNYLILGNNDYCKSIKDGKSNKQKKSEKLKLAGNDIEIITENVFYDMVES